MFTAACPDKSMHGLNQRLPKIIPLRFFTECCGQAQHGVTASAPSLRRVIDISHIQEVYAQRPFEIAQNSVSALFQTGFVNLADTL